MSEGIRISIGLAAPPARVWEALTVPARFKEWFSSCTDMSIDPRVGGKAVFSGGGEDAAYRSEGTILDVLDGRKLFHTVLEGQDPLWFGTLSWSLEPTEKGTRLTLAEAGFQGREEEISDIQEGWRALLLSLCRAVEGSDTVQLPEEYYYGGGTYLASSYGYTSAPRAACWERVHALHGKPDLAVGAPCGLIGDLAPPRTGAILDAIDGRKLMYTRPEDGWDSAACVLLEDMGTETKLVLQSWSYEHRPDDHARAQKLCDGLMDRLVAGLDAGRPPR